MSDDRKTLFHSSASYRKSSNQLRHLLLTTAFASTDNGLCSFILKSLRLLWYASTAGRTLSNQGLTLVHFSAQPEPFLTQKHTLNTP